MRTRQDAPEVLADSGTRKAGDPAGTDPFQPLEDAVTGDAERRPTEEKSFSFLVVLLRALSAWGV